ncbi:MAG: TetR/AcrR family transcriptional regulator [Halioglobus sp.]|nr:TetR/AcrR family transcriptional regulator [Halioglobus sp.]
MSAENLSGRGEQSSPFNRSAQHQAKRAAILSEAARLFNHKGSRATTLRDIAETLGLSKTSLYYYVSTKEELIYQCYVAALRHHDRVLDDIESAHSEPLQRFSAFIMRHFEDWQAAQAGRAPHIAALLEIAALKAPHRQEVEAQYIAIFKRLREFVRHGIAGGSIRPVEPTSTILAVLGSLDWTFSWLRTIPTENVGATADAALDLFTHGLFAGPGSYQPAKLVQPPITDTAMPGFNRGNRTG